MGGNQKWINGQDHLEKTNTFKTFGLFTKKQKQIKGMKYYSIFMKVAPHGYRHHRNNWVNCHFRQNILLDIFYIGSHQQSKGVLTLPDLCYFLIVLIKIWSPWETLLTDPPTQNPFRYLPRLQKSSKQNFLHPVVAINIQ